MHVWSGALSAMHSSYQVPHLPTFHATRTCHETATHSAQSHIQPLDAALAHIGLSICPWHLTDVQRDLPLDQIVMMIMWAFDPAVIS
jgi:predicted GNAT superfamily acetyltransferase